MEKKMEEGIKTALKNVGLTPAGSSEGSIQVLAHASPNCPKCGAPPSRQTVRNFNPVTRLGDVFCDDCDAYVRDYDPT